MKLTWTQKQTRLDWARRNRVKVQEYNRRYRAGREHILRAKAKLRMQRLRNARKQAKP